MSASDTISIDGDFPGGNIIVDGMDGDVVSVHQDLRDTTTDWFYWCFRVRGADGRTLTFRFTQSRAIGVRGPGVSLDGGWTWRWLGGDSFDNDSFSYTFPEDAGDVRFSFGMPYQAAQLDAFLKKHAGSPRLRVEPHCETRRGRKALHLHAGCIEDAPRHRVLITCRHHCCEMMASYALEGMVETALEGGNVEFLVVPFMDMDGVEEGDQGKNRAPHDHGRDYRDGIYPSVRALMDSVPGWSKGLLAAALDLHCPHISGSHNECIYLVGSDDERIWAEQKAFSAILEETAGGPLPYRAADNLPFGEEWNIAENFAGGVNNSRWAAGFPEVRLASGIEIPYANANGVEVTQQSAKEFGRDLARALYIYLERGSII